MFPPPVSDRDPFRLPRTSLLGETKEWRDLVEQRLREQFHYLARMVGRAEARQMFNKAADGRREQRPPRKALMASERLLAEYHASMETKPGTVAQVARWLHGTYGSAAGLSAKAVEQRLRRLLAKRRERDAIEDQLRKSRGGAASLLGGA